MSVKISITENLSKCPTHAEHTPLLPSLTKGKNLSKHGEF